MLDACTALRRARRPTEGKLSAGVEARVVVIDDDVERWSGLIDVLQSLGVSLEISPHIPESLLDGRPDTPICLVLDVKPGRDGLQFQRRLAAAKVFVPII